MSSSNIIGQHLKSKRLDANLRQEDVAARAGLATSTISRIESGLLYPTVPVLAKIGGVLDLTELLAELLHLTKPELPEFGDYLREKYGLSDETIDKVHIYFQQATQAATDS